MLNGFYSMRHTCDIYLHYMNVRTIPPPDVKLNMGVQGGISTPQYPFHKEPNLKLKFYFPVKI